MPLWLELSADGAAAARTPADAQERARALDPARSFIVQAPAGSGKTELLIQRYLTLLARVETPESVVAITFTIKAAGEMRARVVEALTAAAGPEPESAHQRSTWNLARAALAQDAARDWGLLRNTGRMRIQTIDALCMAITRQMPWLARMGAMPDVTEDAALLYRHAAANTIRLLDGHDAAARAVETLLRHLDCDASSARGLLAGMLEIRDHWLALIGGRPDGSEARVVLESTLSRVVRERLAGIRAAVPDDWAAEIAALARFAASQSSADHELAACRDLTHLPGVEPEDAPAWRGIACLLLKSDGEWRRSIDARAGFPKTEPRMKDRMLRLLDSLRGHDALLAALQSLDKMPVDRYAEPQWEILDALFTLLPRAAAELRVLFGERGVVDFIEISQAARHALGTAEHPTDLGLAMGCRVEHLLVDEFQDTSRGQYDLLRALTAGWEDGDGRTLFLVGDPMQSIYRFRQADVGLYLSIREKGLGHLLPEPARLTTNFRSAPGVVQWVNTTFAEAFPAVEDAVRGGVTYSASEAFRPADAAAGVFVHPYFGRQDAAEASQVLRLIEQERLTNGTVAVLVRARTHLVQTAELLRRAGIRFRAIEIDSLAERPAVQDLLALTRALLHLGDRPAWLAILRAPWCGLTLADLEALAGADLYATVWDLLSRADLALSIDGAERLKRVRPVLNRALARRGREPLRRLVEETWMLLSGPACLRSDGDLNDALAYLDLLEREEQAGDLADPDEFLGHVKDLFAAPDPAAPATLELMTVHRAKGLEFDTVIIPGLGRGPKRDEAKLLLWSEHPGPDNEILLAPIAPRHADSDPIYKYLRAEERARSDYETVRLLYVACTRAKRSLHLLGHVGTREVEGVLQMGEPEKGSFLSVIWPAVRQQFADTFASHAGSEEDVSPAASSPLRRLPAEWTALDLPADPLPWNPAVPFLIEPEMATPRLIGTLVHRFLEQMGKDGIAAWSAERVRGSRAAIESGLTMLGVPAAETGAAADTVEKALLRTIGDERGRWILSAHAEAHSELALGTDAGNVQLDRTFVDEDGTRWIVDFKTRQPVGDELRDYEDQLRRYAELMQNLDQRPVRVGLYFPLTGDWHEPPQAARRT